MQKQAIDDVENVPHFMGINSHRKPLSRAIDDMSFAMVYFELEPGERLSGGLHTHNDQEELFYVIEGTATFETKEGPGAALETFEVGPGEVVHFEKSGPYQTGSNESDERVVAVALGVPNARHERSDTDVLFDCPACEQETVHGVAADDPDDERMPDIGEIDIFCRACGNVVET